MTLAPTTQAVIDLIRDNGYAVSVPSVAERECRTPIYDVTAIAEAAERFVVRAQSVCRHRWCSLADTATQRRLVPARRDAGMKAEVDAARKQ